MAITASAAGGNWNTNGAWVGGVQPTAADDVIINATSGNITIPSSTTVFARSVDFTGYTGTFTFAATTSQLDIGDASGGACTFAAGMTLTLTGVGTIRFIATTASTTYDLTTAGKTMPNLTVAAGATTTIRFADNVTAATGTVALLSTGIWDWNGKTVTVGSLNHVSTGSLILGAANVTITGGGVGWRCRGVVNTGTSTINCNGPFDVRDGTTWPDVIFPGNGTFSVLVNQVGASATIGNLTINGSAVKTNSLRFPSLNTWTITGTFTATGNSATNRLLITTYNAQNGWEFGSSPVVLGGSATFKSNCSNVDFRGITLSGGAANERDFSSITGGSGDVGNNSGITFTTAQTNYYQDNSSDNYSTAANWFLATNGAGGAGRVPLPQDTAIFDANSGSTGTYTFDMPRIANFDATAFTGTLGFGTGISFCGNVTFASMNNLTGSANINFIGAGTHTLTSGGKQLPGLANFAGAGTYVLQDDFNCGTQVITLISGTLNTNGKTVAAAGFVSASTAGTRAVTLGSSSIRLSGSGTVWNTSSTNFTVTADTSTIHCTHSGQTLKTFAGGNQAYNAVILAGTPNLWSITGSNTFNVLRYDGLLPSMFGYRSSRPHPFAPGFAR